MITKKEFINAIEAIQVYNQDKRSVSKILCKENWGIVDFAGNLENELIKSLRKHLDDKDDLINWWLFERVEKIIYCTETGKKYQLQEVENLYYYLRGFFKKIPYEIYTKAEQEEDKKRIISYEH